MKTPTSASKPKSGNTSARVKTSHTGKVRVGVESMDRFFARTRLDARRLDRSEKLPAGVTLSFEDPADFLEVITPARMRILRAISGKAVPLLALAPSIST